MTRQARDKIRIVYYCNQLSIGGTERSMELFCKYLDRGKFDVHVVSRIHAPGFLPKAKVGLGAMIGLKPARAKKKLWAQMNARVPNFHAILGPARVTFVDDDAALRRRLLELAPDVLHVWYSGRAEPPTSDEEVMSRLPCTITTNSFEIENGSAAHRFVKRIYLPSRWVIENKAPWAKNDPRVGVFYSPIEQKLTAEDLRKSLNIPADAFVVGRVGRADPGIHDPISLEAFKAIADGRCYFLALSAPDNMIHDARRMGLRNFIPIPSVDNEGLSRFYNTIDVLAHARRDGETFGCNIAEAMMHGKPVVSHLTSFMNAQQEVIGDAGFVCPDGDVAAYASCLRRLREDRPFLEELSRRAHSRAMEQFEATRLARRLEDVYADLARR